MSIYKDVYEFASSAGAFEGYVYPKERLDLDCLDNWIKNLVRQYQDLPIKVRESFQDSLNRTIGRAVQSLTPLLGEDHEYICLLKSLISGNIPTSPHDFEVEKEEKERKFGGSMS